MCLYVGALRRRGTLGSGWGRLEGAGVVRALVRRCPGGGSKVWMGLGEKGAGGREALEDVAMDGRPRLWRPNWCPGLGKGSRRLAFRLGGCNWGGSGRDAAWGSGRREPLRFEQAVSRKGGKALPRGKTGVKSCT